MTVNSELFEGYRFMSENSFLYAEMRVSEAFARATLTLSLSAVRGNVAGALAGPGGI